jgi:DNA adenine methylase
MKPFIKWVGGKQQLLDIISKYWPESFNTYYEPFLGGGSVFLHFHPEKSVLSDLNRTLMNAYICLSRTQDHEELLKYLDHYQKRNTEEQYMKARTRFNHIRMNQLDIPIEETALFIYLNKHGYRGLYRENMKGGYNVPYGNYKHVDITNEQHYIQLNEVLAPKNITLVCTGYKDVLRTADKGDFVFLDPPYHDTFAAYSKHGFTEEDHTELSQVLTALDKRGVKFMCCNSNTTFVNKLYKPFKIVKVSARRAINKNQGYVPEIKNNEVLIMNY